MTGFLTANQRGWTLIFSERGGPSRSSSRRPALPQKGARGTKRNCWTGSVHFVPLGGLLICDYEVS
jgi:hypothetical protein